MCLYPRLIKNRKYTKNKKNGGVIPAVLDKRTLAVPVGCGKCMECKRKKSREWQVRLLEDIRHNKNGIFVTLTFSNESIKELYKEVKELEGYELDNAIAKLATRRFLERWRKKFGKSIRHWLVTELGHNGTENVHMHGIMWTDINRDEIDKIWGYGYTWIGDKKRSWVNEQTVNYITKYINKVDFDHKEYNPKILTSAGIGRGYMDRIDSKNNKYNEKGTREEYVSRTGHKMAMPIYWRNKIYTDDEREKLWIEKLDKEERWVGGERVDISKGNEGYFKVLNHYREKNKRLGYGSNEADWSRKEYEKERRKYNMNKRLGK